MTTKKKLLTALAIFALVAVVAATSVGITFAALQGTATSNFNITYTAVNVKATLKAKYSNNSGTSYTAITPASITFDQDTEADAGTKATKKFDDVTGAKFATATDYVVIAFYFKNDDSSKGLTVTTTYAAGSSTEDNLTVTYLWDTEEANWGSAAADNATPSGEISTAISGITADTQTIEAGQEAVLFVKVAIQKNNKDATFAGGFTFDLAVAN